MEGNIVAYEKSGSKDIKQVDITYEEINKNIFTFRVRGYSGENPLIIDPPLARLWAAYYGGSSCCYGNDYGFSIVTDRDGNVYVTGKSQSSDFPIYNPGSGAYFQSYPGDNKYHAFILKFNNSGIRVWATFYVENRW